jgi:hypothetical protein
MKNLKNILAVTILFIGCQGFAQSIVDGKYSTTFGNISMTTEFDKEFPNGSLIYGDYKDAGTISGYYADFKKEIQGTFFNGSSEGKYIFMMPFALGANQPVSTMNGFWGYNSNNKNSTNSGDKWNITSKTGSNLSIKNETNVWSGKWNTTDGAMHLVQVGNKISGRYKGLGTVTAVYNPSTRLLKGTFLNQNNNKTGYLEFYFEGNTFKGKWGWTTAMTSGNWDGTKEVKNNKEFSKFATSTTNNSNQTTKTSPNNNLTKADDVVFETQLDYLSGGYKDNIYGIGWIRLYIKNKFTNQLELVQPYQSNYLDKYGRVFEIPKSKSIKLPRFTLMNSPIRFKFNPNNFGYNSLDEMKGEAYFEFAFEVKINGIISDEVVGKKSVKSFIETTKIRRVTIGETNLYETCPGFFKIQKDDNVYGIYYSLNKLD